MCSNRTLPCHDGSCLAEPCHAIPCPAVPRHAMHCPAAPCKTLPSCAARWRTVRNRALPFCLDAQQREFLRSLSRSIALRPSHFNIEPHTTQQIVRGSARRVKDGRPTSPTLRQHAEGRDCALPCRPAQPPNSCPVCVLRKGGCS